MARKTYKIRPSQRRIPLLPEALDLHAPRYPGVYRLMRLDERMRAETLYVGLAVPGRGDTIRTAIAQHIMGVRRPTKTDLLRTGEEIYFDYVVPLTQDGPACRVEDLQDIAGALIDSLRPRWNRASPPVYSGRYEAVAVEETQP